MSSGASAKMTEGFARSRDGLNIHFLASPPTVENLLPLVCVPGMLSSANFYETEFTTLSPRRIIAISHRGCGKSEIPGPGQGGFESRSLDIEAVVRHLGLRKYFLMGFSRGVPLAIRHALGHGDEVVGLILIDFPPAYMKT